VDKPAITATGTVTTSATVYIEGAATEATNDYALFVDAGASRFDGAVEFGQDGTDHNVTFYGDTSGRNMRWDAGADALLVFDDVYLAFGNGEDIKIYHDPNVSYITAANSPLNVDLNDGTLAAGATDITGTTTIDISNSTNHALVIENSYSSMRTVLTDAVLGSDVTTDTLFTIQPSSSAYGGVVLEAYAEDSQYVNTVMEFRSYGGQAGTGKGNTAYGLINMKVMEHDGANALTDVTANGNVFSVQARVSDAFRTAFIVDEDGELFAASATVGTFDSYDDAQLIRALDHTRQSPTMIRGRWDNFIKYNEQDLVEAGVLGDTMENGGLLNVTGLQRLHNGAIWQGYVRQQEMQERIDTLEEKLLAIEGV